MTTPSTTALRTPRTGFTLIELVVSLAITSILMVAIGSAIVLAGGAIPRTNDPMIPTDDAYDVGNDMAAELEFATAFSERSVWAVEFFVPSRDGDNTPERIRYEWSGTAGDPLTPSRIRSETSRPACFRESCTDRTTSRARPSARRSSSSAVSSAVRNPPSSPHA